MVCASKSLMPDPRFYDFKGPAAVFAIAEASGAVLAQADETAQTDTVLRSVAALAVAGSGDLSFFAGEKTAGDWRSGRPTACLVRNEHVDAVRSLGAIPLVADRPQAAFVAAAQRLVRPKPVFADDREEGGAARVSDRAVLGPGVFVGPGAMIGDHVVIEPGAVIGPGVAIGAHSRIGARAVLSFCDIGEHCAIHAGAVIGDSGFGLAFDAHGPIDAPHFGAVRIGDRVTIGANTTVDRGRFADTVVGDDAKIDNLVQIAHNVRVGKGCVIAGCCGLAGSAVLEDGVMLGGAVGVADHVTVGAGARLAAAAYLMRDVPPGETWAGGPAKPIQTFFREVAALSRLAKRRSAKTKDAD